MASTLKEMSVPLDLEAPPSPPASPPPSAVKPSVFTNDNCTASLSMFANAFAAAIGGVGFGCSLAALIRPIPGGDEKSLPIGSFMNLIFDSGFCLFPTAENCQLHFQDSISNSLITLNGSLPPQWIVAAALLMLIVCLSPLPALANGYAAVTSFCKGGGARGAVSGLAGCFYSLLSVFASLFFVYRIPMGAPGSGELGTQSFYDGLMKSFTDLSNAPMGPCIGKACGDGLNGLINNKIEQGLDELMKTDPQAFSALGVGNGGLGFGGSNPFPDILMVAAGVCFFLGGVATCIAQCCTPEAKK